MGGGEKLTLPSAALLAGKHTLVPAERMGSIDVSDTIMRKEEFRRFPVIKLGS